MVRFTARASISMGNSRSVRRGQMCSGSWLAPETNRKADIRDRSIILFLAVYGLRVGEVQRLRLEDINWEQKTISITATKQHRTARVCPLIPSLADAIVRYIREVRPETDYQEIFLRLNAPRRPFRHGGLWGIVATRFKRLGINSKRKV
jgi:integrase/recombinase XerD